MICNPDYPTYKCTIVNKRDKKLCIFIFKKTHPYYGEGVLLVSKSPNPNFIYILLILNHNHSVTYLSIHFILLQIMRINSLSCSFICMYGKKHQHPCHWLVNVWVEWLWKKPNKLFLMQIISIVFKYCYHIYATYMNSAMDSRYTDHIGLKFHCTFLIFASLRMKILFKLMLKWTVLPKNSQVNINPPKP